MSLITLLPAYGRTYENSREILSDWNNGKDFYILRGAYCSKHDLKAIKRDLGADQIDFRWIDKDCKIHNFVYWQNQETKLIPTAFVYGSLNGLI